MYKIVIDTKGADKGPEVMIKGAGLALEQHPELAVLLVGDAALIEERCQALGMPHDRVEILDAPGEITNFDNPVAALFEKRDSSLVRGMKALKEREDLYGMIGAGNTGALITGAFRFLSLESKIRPALAALLPAANGSFTCVVDTGATVDCDAETLVHFAHLGSDFMKKTYRVENPRVGLLSNGTEETKGNKLVKETYPLLKAATDLNFIGNVEGSGALTGECDVLVTDGFAGNQVLKVSEGAAHRIIADVARFAKETGSEDAKRLLATLLRSYDLTSLGGAVILGVSKTVIKAHGACNEMTVVNTSEMILKALRNEKLLGIKDC